MAASIGIACNIFNPGFCTDFTCFRCLGGAWNARGYFYSIVGKWRYRIPWSFCGSPTLDGTASAIKRPTTPQSRQKLRKILLKLLHHHIRHNQPIIYLDKSRFRKSHYRPYDYSPNKPAQLHNTRLAKTLPNQCRWYALYNGKLFSVDLFDGNINRQIFDTRMRQILITELL